MLSWWEADTVLRMRSREFAPPFMLSGSVDTIKLKKLFNPTCCSVTVITLMRKEKKDFVKKKSRHFIILLLLLFYYPLSLFYLTYNKNEHHI